MNIPKAIEILSDSLQGRWPTPNTDLNVATKLGIEALKRLQIHRTEHIDIGFNPLPGETKD